jgi:hypothetical protein
MAEACPINPTCMNWMQESSGRLGRIEETLKRIDKYLFGNGQPGEIIETSKRFTGIEERVSKVENWRTAFKSKLAVARWILSGIGAIVLVLIGAWAQVHFAVAGDKTVSASVTAASSWHKGDK